ncbi:MAG: hypothetical protein WDN75_06235 [Bacteroidota bacterium]
MKTIGVSDEVAAKFEQLSREQRQLTLDALSRLLDDKWSLSMVMDDIVEYARKQGTPKEVRKDLFMKTITLDVSDPTAKKIERMSLVEKQALSKTIDQFVFNGETWKRSSAKPANKRGKMD